MRAKAGAPSRLLRVVAACVLALVAATCTDRYRDDCEYVFECAQLESVDLTQTEDPSACIDKAASDLDARSDACLACMERVPCEKVNDCSIRGHCAAARQECKTECR